MSKNKPYKVLQVTPSLSLGGTEKTMQLFSEHLNRELFFPVVWSPTDGPRGDMLKSKGVRVIVGPDLEEAARRFAPDIVHLHRAGWPQPETLLPLRAAFRGDPSGRTKRLPRIIETNIFGRSDFSESGKLIDVTLFVSNFCAERLRVVEKLTIEAPRHQVLYNPVDTDIYAAACPPPEERDYSRTVFGRISRADPGKWSMLVLEALPLVQSERPDFTFLVIGGTDEARAFVDNNGLNNNVRFLPPVLSDTEIAGFMNQISFFAHANKTGESFGLVIAEAMAAGLPVITSPSPDWKDNAQVELVQDGLTGIVADTPRTYADAILRLLREPELCRKMGQAGQKRAQSLFRAQDIARKLEGIYLAALGLPPGQSDIY